MSRRERYKHICGGLCKGWSIYKSFRGFNTPAFIPFIRLYRANKNWSSNLHSMSRCYERGIL